MLTQNQQGGRVMFGCWVKPNYYKLVWNRPNHVGMTKHKRSDIGLPDGMGVSNRQDVIWLEIEIIEIITNA